MLRRTGNFIGGDALDEGYKYRTPGKLNMICKLLFHKYYTKILNNSRNTCVVLLIRIQQAFSTLYSVEDFCYKNKRTLVFTRNEVVKL
jgi:hypothetical protein